MAKTRRRNFATPEGFATPKKKGPESKIGFKKDTPLKINMEPKNEGLEDDFPFQTGDFQVPC